MKHFKNLSLVLLTFLLFSCSNDDHINLSEFIVGSWNKVDAPVCTQPQTLTFNTNNTLQYKSIETLDCSAEETTMTYEVNGNEIVFENGKGAFFFGSTLYVSINNETLKYIKQ